MSLRTLRGSKRGQAMPAPGQARGAQAVSPNRKSLRFQGIAKHQSGSAGDLEDLTTRAGNVVALYETGVELPSDLHCVLYKPLTGNCNMELAKELRAAGIEVDPGEAF